jgi:glutathione S-transferase
MKLYYSNASPYSRKVRLVAREKGVESQIEEILVNPYSDDKGALVAANPLGKIPTLLLDDGTALYDSSVICEYLDGLSNERLLISTNKNERINILHWQALADGIMDAAYNLVLERRRPFKEQSPKWAANWSKEIIRALGVVESRFSELGTSSVGSADITLAHLSLASAISYLDFRLPEILYETTCVQVGACSTSLGWYERFKTHASMQATRLYD